VPAASGGGGAHGRHYLGVPFGFTATSGPLTGSERYTPAVAQTGRPGSGGVAHRTPVDLPTRGLRTAPLGLACAGVALLTWLLIAPRTPDLAAAAYRLDLFKHVGLALYDEHWYGGHDLPGYSVLFPPLAWLLGLRAVGALSVLVSVRCFERLTLAAYGPSARWASIAFALAAVGDVWIGRLAFALGLSFALASVLAFSHRRTASAALLAVMCAAASPVAGVLLALAALSHALSRRSPRPLLVLAAPAAVVVLALAGLFPEGGSEPYPIVSFGATALVVVAFACALPAGNGGLRLGALVYLAACLIFLLVSTPMGSNIERYGVLLAGPLLICAVMRARGGADGLLARGSEDGVATRGGGKVVETAWDGSEAGEVAWDRTEAGEATRDGRRAGEVARDDASPGISRAATAAAVLVVCVWAVWAGWGPVRETIAVAGNPSTKGPYYAPVERFLAEHAQAPVRLEVPLTRTHWETAELAPRVSLARGWEKQLDVRYDSVLLSSSLSAASYERWLRAQAVSYVALPDVQLDPSSAREGKLIRAGLPGLREVFSSRHWRIYAVRAPLPLASGPGRLTALGHDSFALSVNAPGTFLVRVHYTPYWTITSGGGCVSRGAGGWTSVDAQTRGRVLVRASFSLSRALGDGRSCSRG
jgi:hypothetical protein